MSAIASETAITFFEPDSLGVHLPERRLMHTRIPEHLLQFDCTLSSGPGGQNVNKLATKVRMRVAMADLSYYVSPLVFQRFLSQNSRMISDGVLSLTDQSSRSQLRNKANCMLKLETLIKKAEQIPKVRKKTKPSRSSQMRRLNNKRQNAQKKSLRKSPSGHED